MGRLADAVRSVMGVEDDEDETFGESDPSIFHEDIIGEMGRMEANKEKVAREKMVREMKREIDAIQRNYRQINNDDEHERILDALVAIGGADEEYISELVETSGSWRHGQVCDILETGRIEECTVEKVVGGGYDIYIHVNRNPW